MLTDSEWKKSQDYDTGRRRAVSAAEKHWSDNQKVEAVTTYLLLGSVREVSKTLGIPYPTLLNWRMKNWWKELEAELKTQERLVLGARLKNLVEKSLGVIEDRLDKGDFVYDQKAQKLVRKPVAMKDAHKVALDFTVQRQALVTTEQVALEEEGIKEKLEKLAKSFESFAEKHDSKAPVIVTDVVIGKEI